MLAPPHRQPTYRCAPCPPAPPRPAPPPHHTHPTQPALPQAWRRRQAPRCQRAGAGHVAAVGVDPAAPGPAAQDCVDGHAGAGALGEGGAGDAAGWAPGDLLQAAASAPPPPPAPAAWRRLRRQPACCCPPSPPPHTPLPPPAGSCDLCCSTLRRTTARGRAAPCPSSAARCTPGTRVTPTCWRVAPSTPPSPPWSRGLPTGTFERGTRACRCGKPTGEVRATRCCYGEVGGWERGGWRGGAAARAAACSLRAVPCG